MYSMINFRPNLAYSISPLSRFMPNPSKEYWNALKNLLRHINDTFHVDVLYKKGYDYLILERYVDADFVRDKDARKSTLAYFFNL